MLGKEKEDYVLAELLGKDTREVQALLAASNAGMDIHEMLHSLARQKGINPDDPPLFGFADDLKTGQLIIGAIKCGDRLAQQVGLLDENDASASQHTAILGQSGSGKTWLSKHLAAQAMERNHKVLVFCRDQEWRDVLPLFPPDVLLYMEPSDIGVNPLEVPLGPDGKRVMLPIEWVGELKVVFRASTYIRDVASNLFGRALFGLYEDKGVLAGKDDYPCLQELREAVAAMRLGSGKRLGEARDTLIDRLDMIIQFLGQGLNVTKSRDVHKLFSHSILLDVSNLNEVPYAFLFSFAATLLKAAFP